MWVVQTNALKVWFHVISELYTLNQDVIWKSTRINQEFSSTQEMGCPNQDLETHWLEKVVSTITSMGHFRLKPRIIQMQLTTYVAICCLLYSPLYDIYLVYCV